MNDFQKAVINEINEVSAKPTSVSISLYDILAVVAAVIIIAAAASVVYIKRKKK